jgi:hypothetical protein
MDKIAIALVFLSAGLAGGYYLWALNGVGEIEHALGKPIPLPPQTASTTQSLEYSSLSESEISRGIIGKWQSLDDPEFTREFSVDTTVTDMYEGSAFETIEGRWAVFTSPAGEKPPFPIPNGTTYLRISMPEESLYFNVVDLTKSSLILEYLDSKESLRFERAQ